MGSVNIKAAVTSLVPAGTPSPLRLASPQQIRSLNTGLPNNVASSLAKDLDDVNRVVNQLHTNQQSSPGITQLLLTNAAGEVTAAFGPVTYRGIPYTNYLSELHVGNPLKTQNPQQSLFNANLDGSVSIGQNGWIDVHDPFDGNAAWIGTQFDSITIANAVNNGSGEVRLTLATPHTMSAPNNLQTAVRGLNLWNVPNGNGDWAVTIIDAVTLDLNGSIWSGPYGLMLPDVPEGLPTYQATIQRWLEIAAVTEPSTLIEIETTIPHTYESGDKVHFPLPDTATAASEWIITVVDATHFTLDGSDTAAPPVTPADFSVSTCIRYFAGMLAQTIAIGDSFPSYKLRAFANGDLRINNAIINLSSANGSIRIDPATPAIVLTSTTSGAKVTLDASNGSIILNAPTGLAKVVLDASAPDIVLYDNLGVQTIKIDANTGEITATSINSDGGFTGTATVRNSAGTGTSSFAFTGGICTGFTP